MHNNQNEAHIFPANVMGPCSTLLLPVVVTRFARKTPADPPLNATALVSASSLAFGTAAGHKGRSPPTNPAGYSVPRVCVSGWIGRESPG